MTHGPDPHVLCRESGVSWLGEIPAHWSATRLKFVAEVQGGLTLGKNYGAATLVEYPYLRVAGLWPFGNRTLVA
jgi:type I restriction enzyme, S subunit